MILRTLGLGSSLVVAVFAVACSSAAPRNGFETTTSPTDPAKKGGPTTVPSDIGGDGTSDDPAVTGTPTAECGVNNRGDGDPNKDYDGDGYALKDDCNECNTSINKGAQDAAGNGVDEDCSGTADDEPATCDGSLDVAPTDGYQAAAAMGLCKKADANGKGWGLLSAKLVKSDGKALTDMHGVGVVPAFGVNKPKEGKRLFVISSGNARSPKDTGYSASGEGVFHTAVPTGTPAGYPKAATSCDNVPNYSTSDVAADGAGLLVKIRVPSNAKSFSYEHFFMTQEFPDWVCTKFNDYFVTMMTPVPAGLTDGNIAFDSNGNSIGVNSGLFLACKPGDYDIGKSSGLGGGGGVSRHFDCPQGLAPLKGTGLFENSGGTGWLTTSAPVTPGQEISLLFTVWDSGDGNLDSTVILDNFKWSVQDSGTVGTAPTDPK